MKTKKELNAFKNEVEALNDKLSTLSEEEIAQVSGGGSENGEGEKQGYNVAIYPGTKGFP